MTALSPAKQVLADWLDEAGIAPPIQHKPQPTEPSKPLPWPNCLHFLAHDARLTLAIDEIWRKRAEGPARDLIDAAGMAPAHGPPTAREMIIDLMLELGGPTLVRSIRRWAKGHPRNEEITVLLDIIEAPRRARFEELALKTIRDGRYPSAAQIEATRRGTSFLTDPGRTLTADEVRWRRELLTRLGWKVGRGDRWHAPESLDAQAST